MKHLKTLSVVLLIGLFSTLTVYSQFVPDTMATYFFLNKSGGQSFGERPSNAGAYINKLNTGDPTQMLKFVPSNVSGEYFIKHAGDKYLKYRRSDLDNENYWNMDFIKDTFNLRTLSVEEAKRYRYEVLTTSEDNYYQISPTNHSSDGIRVFGLDETADSSSVYSDKQGEDPRYMWQIVKQEDLDLGNTALQSISASTGTFDMAFDPEELRYTLTVPYGTTSVDIDAVPASIVAKVDFFDISNEELVDGIVAFSGTRVDISIVVTSYSSDEETYKVIIKVDDGASDATLKAIDLSVSALDPSFSSEVKSYTTVVPKNTSSVKVMGTSNYPGATVVVTSGGIVAIDSIVTLSGASTVVELQVTSEDETVTDSYTITINKADGTNYAMYFPGGNGQDSHINIGGLKLKEFPYTIEMWFKPEGVQANRAGLLFARADNNDNAGIQYNATTTLIGVSNPSPDWVDDVETGTVTTDTWHHVAFIVTADSSRTIYLDDVETSQPDSNQIIDYEIARTYIGWDSSDGDDSRTFKGLIDEVRVWNTMRTAEELIANKYEILSGSEAGLVAYYNFDLNNPTRAIDLSANANTGAIVGGTYAPSFPRVNLELDSLSVSVAGADFYHNIGNMSESYIIFPIGTTEATITAIADNDAATVNVSGNTSLEERGTITVTVSVGENSIDYLIHYVVDANLTLMHSYTFTDGTAKDTVGGADGSVFGGSISEGIYTASEQGDYINLPGEEIAINTYPSITVEAYIRAGNGDNTGVDDEHKINTMLSYFGGVDEPNGADYYFTTLANNNTSQTFMSTSSFEPWNNDNGVEGVIIDDGQLHHIVSTLTNDSISWSIDGTYLGADALYDFNAIRLLDNTLAYLCKSGYASDKTWIGSILEFNIYKGVMDKQTVSDRAIASAFPYEDDASDATLDSLKILAGDTSSVAGFNSANMMCEVELPFGTSTPPELIAIPKTGVTLGNITHANTLSDTTTIEVTSQNGNYTNTYSITFVVKEDPANVTLSDLTVADTTIAGFDPTVLDYTVTIPGGEALPTIAAVATNEYAYIDIVDARKVSDTTFVTVTSEDSTATQIYRITYKEDVSAISTTDESQIMISPTVSSGEFTLRTDGSATVVTVYNLAGRVVKQLTTSSNTTTFMLTESQMYIVKVDSGNDTQMFKIFKQ